MIFLSTALLLTRERLSPKSVESDTNWRGWTKAQLDHIWAVRATNRARYWAFQATLQIAEFSGQALLDFLAAVRASDVIKCEGQEVAALLLAEQNGRIRKTKTGDYEPIPEAFDIAYPDKIPKGSAPILHRSQKKVFDRCFELGRLHFSGAATGHVLNPRCFPFVLGSTGAGKTRLCREIAKALKAHFVPLTFGRWLPTGSREGRPTMYSVVAHIETHERVCIFLDELDKAFSIREANAWERSVLNDVFSLLDRELPIDDYARYQSRASSRDEPAAVKIDTQRLWVIGSATFQNLTQPDRKIKNIGFQAMPENASDLDIISEVRHSDAIPPELLARFHCEPLLLTYPSPDELPELIKVYGLDRLAAEAGVDLSTIKIDFSKGGMRVFEGIAADLMLKIQRNKEAIQP
jgi:hypothetical protein